MPRSLHCFLMSLSWLQRHISTLHLTLRITPITIYWRYDQLLPPTLTSLGIVLFCYATVILTETA